MIVNSFIFTAKDSNVINSDKNSAIYIKKVTASFPSNLINMLIIEKKSEKNYIENNLLSDNIDFNQIENTDKILNDNEAEKD